MKNCYFLFFLFLINNFSINKKKILKRTFYLFVSFIFIKTYLKYKHKKDNNCTGHNNNQNSNNFTNNKDQEINFTTNNNIILSQLNGNKNQIPNEPINNFNDKIIVSNDNQNPNEFATFQNNKLNHINNFQLNNNNQNNIKFVVYEQSIFDLINKINNLNFNNEKKEEEKVINLINNEIINFIFKDIESLKYFFKKIYSINLIKKLFINENKKIYDILNNLNKLERNNIYYNSNIFHSFDYLINTIKNKDEIQKINENLNYKLFKFIYSTKELGSSNIYYSCNHIKILKINNIKDENKIKKYKNLISEEITFEDFYNFYLDIETEKLLESISNKKFSYSIFSYNYNKKYYDKMLLVINKLCNKNFEIIIKNNKYLNDIFKNIIAIYFTDNTFYGNYFTNVKNMNSFFKKIYEFTKYNDICLNDFYSNKQYSNNFLGFFNFLKIKINSEITILDEDNIYNILKNLFLKYRISKDCFIFQKNPLTNAILFNSFFKELNKIAKNKFSKALFNFNSFYEKKIIYSFTEINTKQFSDYYKNININNIENIILKDFESIQILYKQFHNNENIQNFIFKKAIDFYKLSENIDLNNNNKLKDFYLLLLLYKINMDINNENNFSYNSQEINFIINNENNFLNNLIEKNNKEKIIKFFEKNYKIKIDYNDSVENIIENIINLNNNLINLNDNLILPFLIHIYNKELNIDQINNIKKENEINFQNLNLQNINIKKLYLNILLKKILINRNQEEAFNYNNQEINFIVNNENNFLDEIFKQNNINFFLNLLKQFKINNNFDKNCNINKKLKLYINSPEYEKELLDILKDKNNYYKLKEHINYIDYKLINYTKLNNLFNLDDLIDYAIICKNDSFNNLKKIIIYSFNQKDFNQDLNKNNNYNYNYNLTEYEYNYDKCKIKYFIFLDDLLKYNHDNLIIDFNIENLYEKNIYNYIKCQLINCKHHFILLLNFKEINLPEFFELEKLISKYLMISINENFKNNKDLEKLFNDFNKCQSFIRNYENKFYIISNINYSIYENINLENELHNNNLYLYTFYEETLKYVIKNEEYNKYLDPKYLTFIEKLGKKNKIIKNLAMNNIHFYDHFYNTDEDFKKILKIFININKNNSICTFNNEYPKLNFSIYKTEDEFEKSNLIQSFINFINNNDSDFINGYTSQIYLEFNDNFNQYLFNKIKDFNKKIEIYIAREPERDDYCCKGIHSEYRKDLINFENYTIYKNYCYKTKLLFKNNFLNNKDKYLHYLISNYYSNYIKKSISIITLHKKNF